MVLLFGSPLSGNERTISNSVNIRFPELVTLPGGRAVLLGMKYDIDLNMSFNAVHPSMIPRDLPGMVKIIETLRQAGAPLKFTDKILRIIEEEITAGRFHPHKLPRSVFTFFKVLKLFPVLTPTTRC